MVDKLMVMELTEDLVVEEQVHFLLVQQQEDQVIPLQLVQLKAKMVEMDLELNQVVFTEQVLAVVDLMLLRLTLLHQQVE